MASNESIENEFQKWKLYHQTHGKSISELSPEVNVILRKYAVKKLYDLSLTNPIIKQKIDDYFKLIFTKGQAEKIAKNFDVDKYCIYEDYTNLIEKIYESAEEEYQNRILQNDFSNYLQLIAVYRLLVDMIELVSIWKEKDDNIASFQTFCKYKVIQIMDRKKNKKNLKGLDSQIEQEFKDLKEEIKQDKAADLLRSKTCIGTNNVQMEDKKNNKEELAPINEIKQEELKTNQTMNSNPRGDNAFGAKYAQAITGVQNPYGAISFDSNYQQPQPQGVMPKTNILEQSHIVAQQTQGEVQETALFKQQTMIQPQSTLQQQQFYAQQQQQYYLQQQRYLQQQQYYQQQNQNQLPQSSYQNKPIQNANTQPGLRSSLPPSQSTGQGTTKAAPKRKKFQSKNDQYIEEIENLKREMEGLQVNTKDPKKPKEELIVVKKPEVSKKKEIDFISHDFKKLSTPMLDEYVYDPNKVKITLPIKYQSNDYFGVHSYFIKTLIPTTIKEIQNNNYTKALDNSEDMLYCLTNILPK